MSDKDQFTFSDDDGFPETNLNDKKDSPVTNMGDDDDFPETDLSAAFADGEHEAEVPVQKEEPQPKVKSDGSSRTRILLIVLLLVVAGGAGVYYFMGLGGTTPAVPTVSVPAQKATKSVALPPQPAKAPAVPAKKAAPPVKVAATPAKAEPAAKPVTVAVPPPPPAKPVAKTAPAKQPSVAAKPQPAVVPQPVEKAVAKKVVAKETKPEPVKQPVVQVAVPAPKPVPAPQKAVAAAPAKPKVTALPKPKVAASTKQVAGGAYALDAGSYLLESNRNALLAKIKKLGYEPYVTPIDATLDMTRLRLGTFSKDEVQEALDFARTIEPGSYSAPAGDQYVLYAGTFLKTGNVEKLSQRLLAEGIRVYPEPVQVVRTLSRVRFGSFATKEDAAVAAREVARVGLKTEVVKSK
ncbi:MAG: SPOR domain-containing protein [Deltaproteobacteria bacterium]|nr:SPOR domain-containing protein [Deltaproteobacteria bacterium]